MTFKNFTKFDFSFEEQSRLIRESFGHLPSVWIEAHMERLIPWWIRAIVKQTKWRWMGELANLSLSQGYVDDENGRPVLATVIMRASSGKVIAQKIWTLEQTRAIEEDARADYEYKLANTPAK